MKKGALTANSAGLGTVTRRMVLQRAVELAMIDGRPARDVSPSDWELAKRELTGGSDMDPKEEMLEAVPESERWDPVHGSTGGKVEAAASEDEDLDGRSDSEILTAQGISEAEEDHARLASRRTA